MRFSKFFIPTLKETPKNVISKSHELLIRGGYIAQVGSGIYHFLPLGKIVLENILGIVREEMNRGGAIELALGFVTPASLWQESGRYEKYGQELLRFKDRKENEFILSPTCEESITDLARQFLKSYRDLPRNFYQIHLKFRDEMRPRFGLMRAREFFMKDAYSFHAHEEDLNREFLNMQEVYGRIFDRLGLDYRVVDADSGSIGGSGSKEFVLLASSGEDIIVVCKNCDYAANLEAAKRRKRIPPVHPPRAEFSSFCTPGTKSALDVANFFKTHPFYVVKCVIKKVVFSGKRREELVYFFLRGDDELQEAKALNILKQECLEVLEIVDAGVEEIRSVGLYDGFIGPYSLKNITNANFIFFDLDLEDAQDLICGANQKDRHFVGVDLSGFKNLNYVDLSSVREGDVCCHCDCELSYRRGIEIGHIFKLKTKYSEQLDAKFLDQNGKSQYFFMGCYGIGISRLLSAILEQRGDELGCVWGSVAPFFVHLLPSNIKDLDQRVFSEKLYERLKQEGFEVFYDDRDERFGFKMRDFELIGSSFGLIIGNSMREGRIELIRREDKSRMTLEADEEKIVQTFHTLCEEIKRGRCE